jgi:hypothetical protein
MVHEPIFSRCSSWAHHAVMVGRIVRPAQSRSCPLWTTDMLGFAQRLDDQKPSSFSEVFATERDCCLGCFRYRCLAY